MSVKIANKKEVKKANKELAELKKVKELSQQEALYFKELVDTSNKYVATKKQKAQLEFQIGKLQEMRNDIQSGKIPLPLMKTLIPNMLYQTINDKKEILKMFDEQIETYKNSSKSLDGMIEHNYDEYVESAVRNREFLARRFQLLRAKDIAPERKAIKDEDVLFEAEFNKMMQDPKEQEKFRAAQKEAVKRNVARKTKAK